MFSLWNMRPFQHFLYIYKYKRADSVQLVEMLFLIWFMHMQICVCAFLSFQLSNEKCEFEHTKKYISTICVQQVKFTVNCGGAVDCN